ncbi:MAG: GAF domain-containing protein [Deltaproteobacteria bacterium]|nr:GAF domain-containing protein [Deltaproteobacteria bacterium]
MRAYLKRGFEITEDLLRENQKLRHDLAQVQADNARLYAQVASEDAIRELLTTIEGLEKERNALIERSQELKRASEQYEDRNLQIESELNDLTNLYVAAFQLHGTMSLKHVVRHIGDLLFQFIGVSSYVIYLGEPDRNLIRPIGWTGCDEAALKPEAVGQGMIGEVYLTGVPRIDDETIFGGTVESPVAVIPLMVDDQVIGVISVIGLHGHKTKWASVDKELFKLLGVHACTALIAANLYDREKGPMAALAGIREKLAREGPGTNWAGVVSERDKRAVQ